MTTGIIIFPHNGISSSTNWMMKQICGRAVLGHIHDRLSRVSGTSDIVVLLSDDASSNEVATYCRRSGFDYVRTDDQAISKLVASIASERNWEYLTPVSDNHLFVDTDILRSMLAIAETCHFDLITSSFDGTFPEGTGLDMVRSSFYTESLSAADQAISTTDAVSFLHTDPDHGVRHIMTNQDCPEAAPLNLLINNERQFALAEQILISSVDRRNLHLADIHSLATPATCSYPWQGKSGPLLIAEIGGNHEGNFDIAVAMTESAIRSGADCIKFQIYTGNSLVSPVESPDRNAHFKKFELTQEQHITLAKMCRDAGVAYVSSVWDLELLEWIDPYMDFYKIGSGDVTAWPLLREFAHRGKPILLSTGLCTLDEVLQTVRYIQSVDEKYKRPEWLCLLQCTSMYPIPFDDAQLRVMDQLKAATGLSVGYSDHTEGMTGLRTAIAMGAEVLEFHFTDSREGKVFRDHKVSLTESEVQELKVDAEQFVALRGNGIKIPQETELAHGHEISFRRAAYINKPMASGSTIAVDDLVYLRPAHGTDPRDIALLDGARALKDIEAYEAVLPDQHYQSKKPV